MGYWLRFTFVMSFSFSSLFDLHHSMIDKDQFLFLGSLLLNLLSSLISIFILPHSLTSQYPVLDYGNDSYVGPAGAFERKPTVMIYPPAQPQCN